jgi:hypothetical protein
MATQDYAASIQGVSIRITRLDAAGNLLNGPGDSYVTSAFMRVSFTPEYEEGDEITEKNANGVVCVTYKSPDVLKRITMELAICEPDPEISQLISGGLLLRKTINGDSQSIGWAAPGVGDDPAGNGVSIEVWSHAIANGKKSSVLPYFYWVFPYAKLRQSGDRVIENGMLATTFEGYGLGNSLFGAGPDGRWEFPVAAERPYAYSRSTWAPQGLKGFYTWSDNSIDQQVVFTKSGIQGASNITVSSITANGTTATITLSASASSAEVASGDFIVVSGAGTAFNTVTEGVSATATGNTLTYTVSNVGSTEITAAIDKYTRVAVVDSLAEAPSYAVVTSAQIDTAYANGTGQGTYNVPGGKTYNPDADVDFIIKSND